MCNYDDDMNDEEQSISQEDLIEAMLLLTQEIHCLRYEIDKLTKVAGQCKDGG